MLWSSDRQYGVWPFEQRSELQAAVLDTRADLFGPTRAYIDVSETAGPLAGATPDGYLIDLSSYSNPLLYAVHIDLESNSPLRRIAQQLVDVYLAARNKPKRLLSALRQAVKRHSTASAKCEAYAMACGYSSIDQLFEDVIAPDNFRALVIVDNLDEELDRGLRTSFRFPIEIITFRRFRGPNGQEVLYEFEPFLKDLGTSPFVIVGEESAQPPLDPFDVDTLVVPAREEGFNEVFLGEQMWGPVRIHESVVGKIRYVAAYQVAPVSAVTHVAEVERIEPVSGSSKYSVYFKGPAQKVGPIPAGETSVVAPASNRYTSFARLCRAHSLEEAF